MTSEIRDRISLERGDITQLDVDAVVTAANAALRGGGGVDGAVHAAAGAELLAACRSVGPCPTGEARITPGFGLSAKYVIHAVGPIYQDGNSGEHELLQLAYNASLALAEQYEVAHVAYPCISTGVYGFPPECACDIAVDAVVDWVRNNDLPQRVTFCCFQTRDESLYRQKLRVLGII